MGHLGKHESAIVYGAWAAAPAWVDFLDEKGSKIIDEISKKSRQIHDRTFRDIFGRVGKIFAAVGLDLFEPELVACSD